MDHLTILQQGDQLAENVLMGDGDGGHDDDAGALDSLGHIVGGHGNLYRTLALIAEIAELGTGEGDAGLLNVGKVDLGEAGLVPQADLLALQGAVRSHGLADGTGAQDRDGHILQITHICHCNILLLFFRRHQRRRACLVF